MNTCTRHCGDYARRAALAIRMAFVVLSACSAIATAQTSEAPDLSEFPSVQKVTEAIKLEGVGEADTLARLHGALYQLIDLVGDLYRGEDGSFLRRPDEATALMIAYRQAGEGVYASASTPQVAQAARDLWEEYTNNLDHERQVVERFFTPGWRDRHYKPILERRARADAEFQASQKPLSGRTLTARELHEDKAKRDWIARGFKRYAVVWCLIPFAFFGALIAAGLRRPVRADPQNPLLIARKNERVGFASGIVAHTSVLAVTQGYTREGAMGTRGEVWSDLRQEVHLDCGNGTMRAFTVTNANMQIAPNYQMTFIWFEDPASSAPETGDGVLMAQNHTLNVDHWWYERIRQRISLGRKPGVLGYLFLLGGGLTFWPDPFLLPHLWLIAFFRVRRAINQRRLQTFIADDLRRIAGAVQRAVLQPRGQAQA